MPVTPLQLSLSQALSNYDLNGALDIETIEIGGRNFVYVAAYYDDSINAFEIFSDGTISAVSTVSDDAILELNAVSGLMSVTLASGTYLYATAEYDDSISVFSVANDGSLTMVQTLVDVGLLELDGVSPRSSVVTAGGNRFVVAAANSDDGVSVFQIMADGTLVNTSNIDNATHATSGLDGAYGTASAQIGGTTYVYVGGFNSDTINVFELTSAGALVFQSSVVDDGTLEINGVDGLETLTIGGTTYLYAAGYYDDGLSVFSIGANGALTNVVNYVDDATVTLGDPRDIDSFVHNGVTYLAVSSGYEDGITLFEVAATGELTAVDTIQNSDDATLLLDDVRSVTTFEVDGIRFLLATSINDDSINVFHLSDGSEAIEGTPNNDVLFGSGLDESITGEAGEDIIIAEGGDDTVDGGGGDDVINAGAGDDLVLGDNDMTQTASDVATITETGQDLALTVTLPDTTDGSEIEINGLINRVPTTGEGYNIVYVIDVSGSMDDPFVGTETVGDLNGDGYSNTLLDGTISAYQSLTESIAASGFGNSNVSVVTFDSGSSTAFTGTIHGGVVSALEQLDAYGSTNFEAALQQTILELTNAGPGQNLVYFMSDGANNSGGVFTDEVATLLDAQGLDASIVSIGLGNNASLADLDLVDDGLANNSAQVVLEPSALTANLTGSPVQTSEVTRLDIFVNGTLAMSLDETAFTLTPLGLQYNATVDGLSTSAGDVIEVVLVASDTAATQVSVELTVPNAPLDAGDDILIGGSGDDTLEGNSGHDRIFGDDGNDAVSGGRGNDTLTGGLGDDRILGGSGDDAMFGGAGRDTLQGGIGNDFYYIDRFDVVDESGGAASDFDTVISRLSIDLTASSLIGAFEAATLIGEADVDATGNDVDNLLGGNNGHNQLSGGLGQDEIFGGRGNDTLWGGDDRDTLAGGNNNDTLFGNTGWDALYGGDQNDYLSGGDGNDTLSGGNGNDSGSGGRGNDLIFGGQGADSFSGGDGNDTVYGNTGNDTLLGGNGHDQIWGGDNNDTLYGNLGNDTLWGGQGNDHLSGGDSNDTLYGSIGNDVLVGGNGNDSLLGESGNDTLGGGNGNDTALGGTGNDSLAGGDGNDSLDGGSGNDTLIGNTGTDVLTGGEGHDSLSGGDQNDTLTGDIGNDTLWGGSGDDSLSSGDSNDTLFGEAGQDFLFGGAQNDYLSGGTGNDTLGGSTGNDTLIGGDGQDSLVGGTGADELRGGTGSDTIHGNSGQDTLVGGDGIDSLFGGDSNDLIYGNSGSDSVNGGGGNDTLIGGADEDTLTGGLGNDNFVFATPAEIGGGGSSDVISDFTQGQDVIDLSGIDALVSTGADDAFSFIGTAGHSGAGATLRYTAIGAHTYVYGDVDADGAGDFTLILSGNYTLTASDFIL